MSITVEVTQEDIDEGCVGASMHCPVAKALRRQYPDSLVRVGGSGVLIDEQYYWLSTIGQDFVADFDLGLPVEPCKLELLDE